MRKPTDRKPLYRWWAAVLKAMAPHKSLRDAIDAGLTIEPIPDAPQCGFYKRRLSRGGDWKPARIYLEQPLDRAGSLVGDEVLRCEIGGEQYDPAAQWPWLAGRPITQEEFRFGIGHDQWKRGGDGREPDLDVRVDLLTCEPPMISKQEKKEAAKHGTRKPARRRRARAARS